MTITIASSKSTINYALPTRAKKNKVREKERKLHYLPSCSCLLTSRGVAKSWSFLFPHVVVFSVTIIIESQRMWLCHVWQKLRIISTLIFWKLNCSFNYISFLQMPKKQLLRRLWSGTKHSSISKKILETFCNYPGKILS